MAKKVTEDFFFALIKAGLWEKECRLSQYGEVDWPTVFQLASEQSVLGLVMAGVEHLEVRLPKPVLIQWVGKTRMMEKRNQAMNSFIGVMVERMRAVGIEALLVKGQGVAQCYERPLWRSSGDVDFLLDATNYEKAKTFLIPLASSVEKESGSHLGLTIDSWVVELHGAQHTGLSAQIDQVIDEVQKDCFEYGGVRMWKDGETEVLLPNPNNDVVIIFTHFLKHFYKGGLGLRQICDWCRLLWTYRDELDVVLLERRLREMRLIDEWRTFIFFARVYLDLDINHNLDYGMAVNSKRMRRKADRVAAFVMEVGNFGHNRDNRFRRYPFVIKKVFSFARRCGDLVRHALIFPLSSFRYFPSIVFNGLRSAAKGVG